jgi:hypothetical protein
VKKLGEPIAVVRKRVVGNGEVVSGVEDDMEGVDQIQD